MATKLHDFATNALLGLTVPPQPLSASTTGTTIDLGPGEGSAFAVLLVGEVESGTTVGAEFQASDDGTTWTTLTAALAPSSQSASARGVGFPRSTRYLRGIVALGGSDPFTHAALLIGSQRKTF